MPKMTVDQIKKYIVIGLSLVLAVVGYFRLIHGKTQPEEIINPSFSDSNAPEFEMQIVEPVMWQQEDWHARLAAEPMRPLKRDIFLPARPLKSVRVKPAANIPQKQKPVPSFKLRGTVVGGHEPIAIIDDQFVRTNEWIAGYKVIWIGPKMVVLDSGEKKMILELMQND
jgi:hypothetical protein